MKDMMLPSSTIDVCLEMICKPAENPRNPLHWNPKCTKNSCSDCGCMTWLEELVKNIREKKLDLLPITYSQWIREKEGEKSKQILKKLTCMMDAFVEEVLRDALVDFPEYLRKAWCQWQVTNHSMIVTDVESVAVRTREDFQEDIKFLCVSETVSTHRGVGVVTMVCFLIVIEIFTKDTKEMHGLIIMSDS